MEEGTPSKSKIVSWVTNHNAERRIFMGFDLFVKRNWSNHADLMLGDLDTLSMVCNNTESLMLGTVCISSRLQYWLLGCHRGIKNNELWFTFEFNKFQGAVENQFMRTRGVILKNVMVYISSYSQNIENTFEWLILDTTKTAFMK